MNSIKGIFTVLSAVLLLVVFSSYPAFAGDKALKVGIINIQKVVALSKVGQEARDAVKAKFDEYQVKLRKEEESLVALKDDIEKKGAVWSEEIRTEKQREFERRVKALEDESKYATNDMKEFEKKKVEPVLQELEAIIDDFGKKENYSMILDASRGVIYMDEALDISAAVAAELDKRKGEKK
ncbi:MAG: OmpH family outer membrane protein [Proteobacteria bacterium]|nr:OmpH family outer membrane protein [Pseudomonadota bacterium]MBU1739269.1 OmpH family outer membrane protein [Pseudomonadota bacterium]